MMNDIHSRLQTARLCAGYASATEAAREMNFNENTYRSHENGERGIRIDRAVLYAEAFQVSLSWLLTGTGSMHASSLLAVTGYLSRNSEVYQHHSKEASINITVPFQIMSASFVFMISDHSLYPRYNKGDIIICWKSNRVLAYTIPAEGVAVVRHDKWIYGTLLPGNLNNATLEIMGRPPMRGLAIKEFFHVHIAIRAPLYDSLDTTDEPPNSTAQFVQK